MLSNEQPVEQITEGEAVLHETCSKASPYSISAISLLIDNLTRRPPWSLVKPFR